MIGVDGDGAGEDEERGPVGRAAGVGHHERGHHERGQHDREAHDPPVERAQRGRRRTARLTEEPPELGHRRQLDRRTDDDRRGDADRQREQQHVGLACRQDERGRERQREAGERPDDRRHRAREARPTGSVRRASGARGGDAPVLLLEACAQGGAGRPARSRPVARRCCHPYGPCHLARARRA